MKNGVKIGAPGGPGVSGWLRGVVFGMVTPYDHQCTFMYGAQPAASVCRTSGGPGTRKIRESTMKQFRKYASSCFALATLLTFQSAAIGGLIVVDSDTDGTNVNRAGNFNFTDGYVKLFDFTYLSGSLEEVDVQISSFTKTVEAFPNDFSIIFLLQGTPANVAVAQIGTSGTHIGAHQSPTTEGMQIDDTGFVYGANGGIDKYLSGGFTKLSYASGVGLQNTARLEQLFDITSEGTLQIQAGKSIVTTEKRLNEVDAAKLSAYYFNGYTAGRVASSQSAPPSGRWQGTIEFTATGGSNAVPEPGTSTMVALGMLTLLGGLRRRRR